MRDAGRFHDEPAAPPPAWVLVLMGLLVGFCAAPLVWGVTWAWIVLAMALDVLA